MAGEATGATQICAVSRHGETWGEEDEVEMDNRLLRQALAVGVTDVNPLRVLIRASRKRMGPVLRR